MTLKMNKIGLTVEIELKNLTILCMLNCYCLVYCRQGSNYYLQ